MQACAGLFGARTGRLSQRAVAAEIGTGQGVFWAYEHVTRIPWTAMVDRWATAVGCQLAIRDPATGEVTPTPGFGWQAADRYLLLRRERCPSRKILHAETGLCIATMRRIEETGGPKCLITSWAAYLYAIGQEPFLVGRDGQRACHTR